MFNLNIPLARRVRDHIAANPEQFDMETFGQKTDCGTVACIGGWAVILDGYDVSFLAIGSVTDMYVIAAPDGSPCDDSIEDAAAEALGLGPLEAEELFYGAWANKLRYAISAAETVAYLDRLIAEEESANRRLEASHRIVMGWDQDNEPGLLLEADARRNPSDLRPFFIPAEAEAAKDEACADYLEGYRVGVEEERIRAAAFFDQHTAARWEDRVNKLACAAGGATFAVVCGVLAPPYGAVIVAGLLCTLGVLGYGQLDARTRKWVRK